MASYKGFNMPRTHLLWLLWLVAALECQAWRRSGGAGGGSGESSCDSECLAYIGGGVAFLVCLCIVIALCVGGCLRLRLALASPERKLEIQIENLESWLATYGNGSPIGCCEQQVQKKKPKVEQKLEQLRKELAELRGFEYTPQPYPQSNQAASGYPPHTAYEMSPATQPPVMQHMPPQPYHQPYQTAYPQAPVDAKGGPEQEHAPYAAQANVHGQASAHRPPSASEQRAAKNAAAMQQAAQSAKSMGTKVAQGMAKFAVKSAAGAVFK